MEDRPDNSILKTYVYTDAGCYYVSTIERDSSAMVSPPMRFNETIAWEWNKETRERGNIVMMEGEGVAIKQHFGVVSLLMGGLRYELDDQHTGSATPER